MQKAAQHLGSDSLQEKHAGKLALFPHINMAMTQRGDGLLTGTVRAMLEMALPDSFDDAVRLMPALLEQAQNDAMAFRQERLGVESFPGAEMALVGWSPTRRGFAAARWRRYPDDPTFVRGGIQRMLLTPEVERLEPVEAPDTAEKMVAIARRQVAWVRQEHPSLPCGSRLLLAELTRGTVTARTIADLEK